LQPAIFFDRDGVLNKAMIRDGRPHPPASIAELVIDEVVPTELHKLKNLGYLLIGITNQPDVARGRATRQQVEAINDFLLTQLPLNEIRVCYHDDADGCHCRKPLPGLILDAAKDWEIDLPNSYMIGDRWRDVEAGNAAGCKTIWLNAGYQERTPFPAANITVNNFTKGVQHIFIANGQSLERKS
jgi:D-glycero-D-manno-heptose 1,7-bisphosphate phosphatase